MPESDHGRSNGRRARSGERRPLAAGAKHEEDRIGTGAIRHPRSSAAEAMGIDVDGQQGLQHRPQGIGDAKAVVVRLFGVRCRSRFLVSCGFM